MPLGPSQHGIIMASDDNLCEDSVKCRDLPKSAVASYSDFMEANASDTRQLSTLGLLYAAGNVKLFLFCLLLLVL